MNILKHFKMEHEDYYLPWSCPWSRLELPLVASGVAPGHVWSCPWSRLELPLVTSGVAPGRAWSCPWSRLEVCGGGILGLCLEFWDNIQGSQ